MKCPNCKKEFEEQKTIKIPQLGIEVEIDVTQKNTSFEDIEGWRLLTIEEVIYLANNEEYANQLKMFSKEDDFFFEQPFTKNKEKGLVARFVSYSDGVDLDCCRYSRCSNSALGVRFCRKLK